MLTAARESSNPNDFALVAMLGLLGSFALTEAGRVVMLARHAIDSTD
jgi:hypothetical protein